MCRASPGGRGGKNEAALYSFLFASSVVD